MFENFFSKYLLVSAILIILSLFLNLLLIYNKKLFSKFNPSYNPIQKIHEDYTPPFGGIVIFILFFLFVFIDQTDSKFTSLYFIIPSILIIAIGLSEDIYGNASPALRFIIIFCSSILFLIYSESLPSLEIPIIGDLINNNFILQILFYSIALTAISNGLNMIDGMNGLAGFTVLSMLVSLLSLVFIMGIEVYFGSIIILMLLIAIFILFNFPFGKIFLGDAGAYWIGWTIGIIVIDLFSSNKLNTWGAPIILFYPAIEVIFSTIRKLIQRKNPLKPDVEHLHLKLYFSLKGPIKRSVVYNSFTTLCLMPFWSIPPLAIMWTQYLPSFTIYFLLFLILVYIIYYKLIPPKQY